MDEQGRKRLTRTGVLGLAGCALGAIVALVVWRASSSRANPDPYVEPPGKYASSVAVDEDVALRIEAFCSDCHGMPRAENYPRDAWHHEVQRGYEFYARSGRNDLDPPPMHLAVTHF